MSRTVDPYDNALMESCIGTLKIECADHVFLHGKSHDPNSLPIWKAGTTGDACIPRLVIAVLTSLNISFSRTNFFSTPRGQKLRLYLATVLGITSTPA